MVHLSSTVAYVRVLILGEKCVLSAVLNLSSLSIGSGDCQVEFQDIRPTTENARRPNLLRQTTLYFTFFQSETFGSWHIK